MPLTPKGKKIKAAMEKEYGKGKGERVFYASRNKGTISGVDAERKRQEEAGDEIASMAGARRKKD